MSVHELYAECAEDLSYRELTAFHSHLVGGLLQSIEDGHAGKANAKRAIEAARSFAIRERAS